jgi:hypothetical protein
MRRSARGFVAVLVPLFVWSSAYPATANAQTAAKSRTPEATESKERYDRLEDMRRLAAALSFEEPGETPALRHLLIEKPLIHYTDADRGILDGTLWAYGREGRPVAVVEMYCARSIAPDVYRHATTATADRPVKMLGAPGIEWTPEVSAVAWADLATDAPPAAEPAVRLRQIKALAKRFSAYQIFEPGAQREELRQLVQPLHRYSEPTRHIQDGALFAFALGTNPEALLFIESRDDDRGEVSWHYGFARRGSSASIHGLLDTKEVWTVPRLVTVEPRDPHCHFLRPLKGNPVLTPP